MRILTLVLTAILTADVATGQMIDLTGKGVGFSLRKPSPPDSQKIPEPEKKTESPVRPAPLLATQSIPVPASKVFSRNWHQILVWPGRGEWLADDVRDELSENGWAIGDGEDHIRLMGSPKSYGIKNLPALVVTDAEGEVIREFSEGCGQRLDIWALQWLATGEGGDRSERIPETAKTSGSYPLRGNWWSVSGVFNASRQSVLRHLRRSPNHIGKSWQAFDLETWSAAELHSLHSDDHEGTVRNLRSAVATEAVADEQCPT